MKPIPSSRTSSAATVHPAGWRWAVLGAMLGLGLALLVWAPARWLAWGVQQASQGQVQLLDARGTVWNGTAQLVLSGGAGSRDAQALPGRLHWRIAPGLSTQNILLRADCCMASEASVQLQAGLSTQQMRISDHRAQWPAALLTGLGAPWNTLQADGTLQWRTESLQLNWAEGRLQMQGLAELEAQSMSSRLSTLKPMGSYRIVVRGTPGGTATPDLQLTTLQGPLNITGQGQWVGSRLRFSGEASAEAGSEAALSNLLNIMGRRQGTRSLLSLG
jgi:general secretion pathway protein N